MAGYGRVLEVEKNGVKNRSAAGWFPKDPPVLKHYG